MDFPSPLQRGTLVQRYKRFFADVRLDDGTRVTAHCPNPGAMLGLKAPGMPVWLSRSADPKRKLPHTLELVDNGLGLVGVNTMNPNRLAAEAIAAGAIPELADYASLRREVGYDGDSRIDILLESPNRPRCWVEVKNRQANNTPAERVWVEVKNCHFVRTPGLAEFPDCVAARSAKHMGALARRVEAGDRAVVLWIIQMHGIERFTVARDIDPTFAAALDDAVDRGVEVLSYTREMSTSGINVARSVPWVRHT